MTQIDTVKRNNMIKHLAKEGKTADEIAEIVAIKRYRVMQILRAYKIKAARKTNKLHCDKAQAIKKELEKGTKEIDIAKKLNVSRQYVNQVKKIFSAMNPTNKN